MSSERRQFIECLIRMAINERGLSRDEAEMEIYNQFDLWEEYFT